MCTYSLQGAEQSNKSWKPLSVCDWCLPTPVVRIVLAPHSQLTQRRLYVSGLVFSLVHEAYMDCGETYDMIPRYVSTQIPHSPHCQLRSQLTTSVPNMLALEQVEAVSNTVRLGKHLNTVRVPSKSLNVQYDNELTYSRLASIFGIYYILLISTAEDPQTKRPRLQWTIPTTKNPEDYEHSLYTDA
eukprot:6188953-Pleurochrysis_carterae.AAC.6